MTQQVPVPNDPLVSLFNDLRAQRERIGKIAEPTPKKALTELSDTGLSVTEDLVNYFLQFRQYVSESFEDIDVRLTELESSVDAASGLSDEEVGMILQLATTCEVFVTLVKETSTSISPDARKRIDEALALVSQVRSWVAERVAEEQAGDEEDDAEGGDEA